MTSSQQAQSQRDLSQRELTPLCAKPYLVFPCLVFPCLVLLTAWSVTVSAQDNDNDVIAKPGESIVATVTTLPHVDRAIHDAMQSRTYGEAIKLIEAAIGEDTGGPSDYLRYLQGIALTEDGKLDEALEAFATLERDHPDSDWLSRSRFGRAHAYVLRRQYIEAGQIYQQEAERLLSQGRKDTLAQIYLEFADRYFEGIPADDPSKAKQPDYQQALTYYSEAARLGTTTELTQNIEFRIARCHEELAQFGEAIASYEKFLDQYGKEVNPPAAAAWLQQLAEARFRLGEVQLKSGNSLLARRTWQDFLSDWSERDEINDQVESFLSRAQYRLAHTYGLPTPSTIGDLELAVTAAEKFLERYPTHELAPQAELEIAQGYAQHQRHAQAVRRLLSLLDTAGYVNSPQVPIAREMLGQEYLAQREFDQAISAWKDFLEKHPTDPKWPSVQNQILDTEYAKADDARTQKKYEEARSLWMTFLNKYPLDARASSILLQFGQMKFDEAVEAHQQRVADAIRSGGSPQDVNVDETGIELYEQAIADWRRLVVKYPGSGEASRAAFLIGSTLEDKLGRLDEALESYRRVTGELESKAQPRIARLTTPQLQIMTERKYRSDEKPRVKLTTRNLESVEVKVYRVDMVDYFRKMHLASGLETLDIALIDPDEQFTHKVDGYESYKQIERDVELPIDGPGVAAVTVSAGKLESTTMVIVSDLEMIVKASRNELFLFVEDMRTLAPAAGVSILISDGDKVFAEAVTNEQGILQQGYDQLKSANDLRLFAIRDGHMAATVNDLNGLDFAVGLSPRGYLYTDRPAYRAGQAVNIKGIVRWVEQDRHLFRQGESFQLDVIDPRGRQLLRQEVSLNDFGTLAANLVLPSSAAQGNYRIHLHRSKSGENDKIGDLSFDATFTVTEYQLEPVQISIDVERDVYFRGDVVRGTIQLQYYYGMPLAGETLNYRIGSDGELITAKTDAEGKIAIELETQRFNESQLLPLSVEYPERSLQTARTIYLATRGFAITASTTREVFLSGEPFESLFTVTDPAGKPVAAELKLEVLELIQTRNGLAERLVETHSLRSEDNSGETTRTLRLSAGGTYVLRASSLDQFGNQVSGQTQVTVSGDEDSTRLRILADQLSYTVGELAAVNLHWREQPALALITLEGASILSHRLVMLQEGDNEIELAMTSDLVPNVFLNIAVMQRNEFFTAQAEFRVSQAMKVAVKPALDELKPGEDLTVEIEATDPNGKPLQAELSLAVIQASLLDAFGDSQTEVHNFFGAGYRRASVRQNSSCTFAYRPETRSVSRFLLAEEDRREWMERESRARDTAGGMLGGGFFAWGGLERATAEDANMDGTEMGMGDPFGGPGNSNGAVDLHFGADFEMAYAEPNIAAIQLQQPSSDMSMSELSAQLPGLGMQEVKNFDRRRLDRFGGLQQALSPPTSVDASTTWQFRSVNGMTATGKLVTVNANSQSELAQLAQEQNLQLIANSQLAETAFWDPFVVTDTHGKATVTLTMPQRSTAWRIRARGINTETMAGEASAEIITKKELFAELKLPLAFVAGDRAQIPVEIHQSQEGAKTVAVRLKATAGDKSVEQTRQVELGGRGISRTEFDIEIESADLVSFELSVLEGATIVDQTSQSVLIRPYGFPVFETAGGTSSQSTLALIDFESPVRPEGISLQISIGPSLNRFLLESVTGSDAVLLDRCLGPVSTPIERSTSDILGGVAVASWLGVAREATRPEAQSINGRIIQAIAQLVSAQNEQGGWSWNGSPSAASDPYLSARVMWAWSVARSAGFAVPQASFESGKSQLQSAFASSSQGDLERQAILLHAMAESDCGDFALANRLYRERNRLNPSGLVHLILAMEALQHGEMAADLLELVKIPAEGPIASASGASGASPWMRDPVEVRAMYLLALQSNRPSDAAVGALARSLLASRIGARWPIEKANGPAIASLATWFSKTQNQSETYRLRVSVNDQQVVEWMVDPSIDVSRQIDVPSELLRNDRPQRIEFQLEGRATFTYSAVLSGFLAADKIAASTNTWAINRRYEPAHRMLDGRPVPRGFSVVDGNYRYFINPLTQLAVGNRAEVTLSPRRNLAGTRDEPNDYLILTEPIPAGCSVLQESVQGSFERFEIEPGRINFFIGSQRNPGNIQYTLVGYVPGQFRTAPSLLRNYFDPSAFAIAEAKSLQVVPSGSPTVDEYRLTPDELYHFGKHEFEHKQYDAAHQHLSELYTNWQLDPDAQKHVTEWLFLASLAKSDHGDTVRYFEVLKEKFPEVEISFQDILQVAKAYREIGEYERGYLVYRATIQASFERESQVAGFLNARGEFVRSVQEMERLHRDYPAESYLATATYALAQETYRRADSAHQDEKLRALGLTRIGLIDGAIKMLDNFLTTWPNDPANDEASFALATALIDLEQYDATIERSEKYAARYPDSRLIDSYWYMIGYSHFELQHPQEALEMCRKVADATFRVPQTGGTRPAENRWEAIYIMGQIYHSLGQAAGAIAEYTRVKDRFADAAEAITFFSRKSIGLDEVTTIRPDEPKQVELEFRNVEEVAIKVYRIDLMKFGLMQRNLDRITAINLAGIRPYYEETVKLGDGKDYRDRTKTLALPLEQEGAYLMVCRGDNLYTSGLALVTPLALQIQEDADSGRVRVSVKNSVENGFVSDVHVKVIGSANDDFVSGDTDLRGLFIADDIRGTSTVIAATDKGRYAFYRGETSLQGIVQSQHLPADLFESQVQQAEPSPPNSNDLQGKGSLRDNLFNQNRIFQEVQKGNYDELMNNGRSGVKSKEAF